MHYGVISAQVYYSASCAITELPVVSVGRILSLSAEEKSNLFMLVGCIGSTGRNA